MTISLDFYTTAGMTTPLDMLSAVQAADGSGAAADLVIYLGSTVAGKKFRSVTNPGTDPIMVSINDSNAGAGVAVTAVKLALSSGDLATAAAGMPLNVGTQLLSGAANVLPIYVRIDTPALAIGKYTDLSLATSQLLEEAV